MGTRSKCVPVKTWRKIRAFRNSEESFPFILSLQALPSLSQSSALNAPDGDVIALNPGMRGNRGESQCCVSRREMQKLAVQWIWISASLLYMVHEAFHYPDPSKKVEMPFPLLEKKKLMGDHCPTIFSSGHSRLHGLNTKSSRLNSLPSCSPNMKQYTLYDKGKLSWRQMYLSWEDLSAAWDFFIKSETLFSEPCLISC